MDRINEVYSNSISALEGLEKQFGSVENALNAAENLANKEITCRCGFINGPFRMVRFSVCPICSTAPSIYEPGTELYAVAQRQAREMSDLH